MSDGFNARNEIITAFNNLANPDKLQEFKKAIDNFEKDDPLFNTLSFNGEEFTLSQKGSNGEFEAVSEDKFKKFINTIAKEYGIDLDNVADDAELMFKILDNDGNGILEADELQALKDSDANESKSRKNKKDIIDGFTLRRYFSGIDKEVLLEEYALIEDILNTDESDDNFLAISHDVDVEDIKAIRNGDNSSSNSRPDFVNEEKIIEYAALFDINSSTDDIKAKMQSTYRYKSDADLEKIAKAIKNVVGTRNYNEDGSYYDVKKNTNGEKITEEIYYSADGEIKFKNTYTYNDDGSYTKLQKPLDREAKRQRSYDEKILKDGYGEYNYDKDNKLTGYRVYNKDNKLYHTNDITYYENTLNNEPQRKHAISKWHNPDSGILEVSYENNYKENGDFTQTYKEYDKNEEVTCEKEFNRDKYDNPI